MKRYLEIEKRIEDIVRTDSAQAGIEFLRSTVQTEPQLEDVCHGLSHAVGEAAFERYGFENALSFEQDICGSGYVHGIVEAYLAHVDNVENELLTLCKPDAAKCFHGVGHGLMDRSQNDLPGSLALCDRFTEKFQKVQCAEGVFMENFEADPTTHPTSYVSETDPYSPCRNRGDVYEGVCAFYVPRYFFRLHPRQYEDALSWCQTIPIGPRDGCIKGVGDAAMKQNISNPLFAESICMKLEGQERQYCIEGLISYYIVHTASSREGFALCERLQEDNRDSCRKVALQSARFYPN